MKAQLLHRDSVKSWTQSDNLTNLKNLALEYLTLAVVLVSAAVFFEWRNEWGLSWIWSVPAAIAAIVAIGSVQHRLASLGHEASHYTLFTSRFWNDLAADIFLFFPLFGTTQQYRTHHVSQCNSADV